MGLFGRIQSRNSTGRDKLSWPDDGAPAASFESELEHFSKRLENGELDEEVDQEPLLDLKWRLLDRLLGELDPVKMAVGDPEELRGPVTEAAAALLTEEDVSLPRGERLRLLSELADEVLGLGPLEPLIKDDSVSEVMVNGPERVYYE